MAIFGAKDNTWTCELQRLLSRQNMLRRVGYGSSYKLWLTLFDQCMTGLLDVDAKDFI